MFIEGGRLYNVMAISFSEWLEAVTMDNARRARKGMQRSWKKSKHTPHKHRLFRKYDPGTFGLELEFRIESEEGDSHHTEEELEEVRDQLQDKLYDIIWRHQPSYQSRDEHNPLRDAWYEFTEDKYPPYDSIHDWEHENEEPEKPEKEDYEDDEEGFNDALEVWEKEHAEWQEERENVEEQIDKFDHDELQKEFIDEIIDEERWHEYEIYTDHYLGDFDTKAEEYEEFLFGLGWTAEVEEHDKKGIWNLHRDGDGIFELTSPILTQKDIPALTELFNHAQHEVTDGDTSCHIHVGMPEDTDGFDLVAITTMADEPHIIRDQPNRNFQSHADFNSNLQYTLSNKLPDGVYSKDEFMTKLRSLNRTGTNLTAFGEHGTVEFRYLSSEALDTPDMVFSWVNYFLTLPKIARGRKQIRIDDDVYLTRMPGGAVKVDRQPEGRVKQGPGSPEDLRRSKVLTPYEKKKKQMKRGMVERYVDKMNLNHFSMQFGGGSEKHVTDAIRGVITRFMGNLPIVKRAVATHPEDPYFNDWENYMLLAKHLTMSDIFSYSTGSDDYGWLRKVVYDLVEKRFDIVRKNVQGWKQQSFHLY
tara:strand:- start:13622 stop:15379 length:1758 start_codon:yes stop_codon:yes gene_type:complete